MFINIFIILGSDTLMKKSRGVVMIEFAIVLPIFLLLFFGIYAAISLFRSYNALGNITREATLWASAELPINNEITNGFVNKQLGLLHKEISNDDYFVVRKDNPTGYERNFYCFNPGEDDVNFSCFPFDKNFFDALSFENPCALNLYVNTNKYEVTRTGFEPKVEYPEQKNSNSDDHNGRSQCHVYCQSIFTNKVRELGSISYKEGDDTITETVEFVPHSNCSQGSNCDSDPECFRPNCNNNKNDPTQDVFITTFTKTDNNKTIELGSRAFFYASRAYHEQNPYNSYPYAANNVLKTFCDRYCSGDYDCRTFALQRAQELINDNQASIGYKILDFGATRGGKADKSFEISFDVRDTKDEEALRESAKGVNACGFKSLPYQRIVTVTTRSRTKTPNMGGTYQPDFNKNDDLNLSYSFTALRGLSQYIFNSCE